MRSLSIKNSAFIIPFFLFALNSTSQAGLFSKGPYKINVPGAKRDPAHVYIPDNYKSGKKWPLIMLLHGSDADAELENIFLGLSFLVTERGFVLLLPEGTKDSQGSRFWNATEACCNTEHIPVDDVSYLLGLIEQVKQHYSVDNRRVYIFGHSNGGFMAYRLACEASSTFAAIASLAGATFQDQSECHVSEPVSVLEIHAIDDSIVHYDGGHPGEIPYPSAVETVNRWVRTNGCDEASYLDRGPYNLIWSIPGKDTKTRTWSSCQNGTETSLWTIRPFPLHFAHAPWFKWDFVERVLTFLLSHQKTN